MIKYYYTDPVKVEWMLREFGMKFQYRQPVRLDTIRPGFIGWEVTFQGELNDYTSFRASQTNKAYVHPDCHEMLEPQEKDIGVDIFGSPYEFLNNALYYEKIHIIHRQGKAFFVPEAEDD